MLVGEVYRVQTNSVYCEDNRPNFRPKVAGRVTWVHPLGRFAVLMLPGGAAGMLLPGGPDGEE